jgi:redox-sensitive bicupin YhaK (pirin superfamily)
LCRQKASLRFAQCRTCPVRAVPAGRLQGRLPWHPHRGIETITYVLAGTVTEKEVDGRETLIRESVGNRSLVLFDSGDEVTVQAGEEGIRFLLVSGKPIREPVAWYGPIVMNTQAELNQALRELRAGTFSK